MESVIRATVRRIRLITNYPKGSGYLFLAFMEECHPGGTFLHVKDEKIEVKKWYVKDLDQCA